MRGKRVGSWKSVVVLWCLLFVGCRSAEGVEDIYNDWDSDVPQQGDDGRDSNSPKSGGDNEHDNSDDNDTDSDAYPAMYDCEKDDATSCDSQACLYEALREVTEEGCPDDGEAYCHAIESCFDELDDCFYTACPPGQSADDADSDDYAGCTDELSACLAEAANDSGTDGGSYRHFSLMPGHGYLYLNDNGFRGFWYKFTDEDDGGDSVIDLEEHDDVDDQAEELCVTGEASLVVDDDWNTYWGAGFGVDLCGGDSSISDCDHDLASQFKGIEFDVVGEWGTELRVLFKETDRDKSAYVNVAPDATHVVAWVDQAEVWYDPGNPVNVDDITAVQFHIATNTESETPFDLCVSNVVALLRD